MTSFAAVTALSPSGPGRFDADVSSAWTIGGKPNGGYLLAMLGRAALAVGSHEDVIAASAHYLHSPDPGAVTVAAEVLRAGRSASQLRAWMAQEGRRCVEALITISTLSSDTQPYWSGGVPHSGTGVRDGAVRLTAAGTSVAIMDEVDVRLDKVSLGFTKGEPTGSGELRGWLSLPEDEPFDSVSLLYAVDAFPPALRHRDDRLGSYPRTHGVCSRPALARTGARTAQGAADRRAAGRRELSRVGLHRSAGRARNAAGRYPGGLRPAHGARASVNRMRAITYTQTGDADVLTLVDKELSDPGPGEVRVRIHRSGVNPTDWKSRRGSEAGTPVDPPQVPNQDGSGVVDAVGPGVGSALAGLRVWVWEAAHGRPEGTAQEFAIVPARQVVTLPDSASFDLGASLGVPFVTAHRCLTVAEDGPTRLGPGALSGRTVLVAGGAGAVGNAAIQLARWSDATVISTVSSADKALLAAAAGADHVVNYRELDAATEIGRIAPRGVHSIVEVAPSANAALDAQVLAPNGSVAIYANNGGDELTVPIRPLMTTNARWQFVLLYTAPAAAKARALEDVASAVLDGAARVGEAAGLPLHHFPLERAADAHAAVENSIVGKVLIDITN